MCEGWCGVLGGVVGADAEADEADEVAMGEGGVAADAGAKEGAIWS